MANSTTGDGILAPGLEAGLDGTGTVTIDTGPLTVNNINAGTSSIAVADGTITITGVGADVLIDEIVPYSVAPIQVGATFGSYAATGVLNIDTGATVTSNNRAALGAGGYVYGAYRNLTVGSGANADGTVIVTGTGGGGERSSLILTSALDTPTGGGAGFLIGISDGNGQLDVTQGGYFRTHNGNLGVAGGTGTINVTTGGEFLASTLSGNFIQDPQQAPVIEVGVSGGTGTINVNSGGLFRVQNEVGDGTSSPTLVFGETNGSTGLGTVDGDGTLLAITQYDQATSGYRLYGNSGLVVGNAGYGSLTVSNNAEVQILGDRANLEVSRGFDDGMAAPLAPTDANDVERQSLLTINSGAYVLVDSQGYGDLGGGTATIGTLRASLGTVTVSGANPLDAADRASLVVRAGPDLENDYITGKLTVGELGSGNLIVDTDGYVSASALVVGAYGYTSDPQTGATTSTFYGYNAAPDGGGVGVVTAQNGGQIVINGSDNTPNRGITLGQASGATGSLTVSGAQSYVKSTGGAGQIVIGRYGEASVGVTGGGALYGNAIIVSEQSSGDDTDSIFITGVGSKVVADGYYGRTLDGGGLDTGASASIHVGLGYYSTGSISVLNGGELRVENDAGIDQNPKLVIGTDVGAIGSVSVLGSGSPTPATSSINIIQQGARFTAPSGDVFGGAELIVGLGGVGTLTAGYYSTVSVQGDSATLQVGVGGYDGMGAPIISASPSVLTIENGADVLVDSGTYGFDQTAGDFSSGSSVIVGGLAGGYGQIYVDGSGSTLTVDSQSNFAGDYQSGRLVVGQLGNGYLNVANGGAVDARMLQVGAQSFYDDGSGPVFGGYLPNVTYAANGFVYINSGSQITVTAESNTPSTGIRIAEGSGTVGSILVRGSGSTLTSQGGEGRVLVGRYGTGDLLVDTGGLVRGFSFDIGRSQGSDGTVSVDGYGSSVLVSNAYGNFSAEPEFAGEAGFLRLGREAGSSGFLQITNAGRVDVINDPATNYDNPFVQIGRNNGSYGNLLVDGYYAGSGSYYSQLNIIQTGPVGDFVATGGIGPYGPRLAVGQGGQGVATVSDLGQILIQGAAAKLSVASGRRDGNGDPDTTTDLSTLTISGGSSVLVDSQTYGGSQDFTDPMGGTITANLGAQITVGSDAGANGQITVDGEGSTLTVTSSDLSADDYSTGSIRIGLNGGTGALNVANGGDVYGRGLNIGFDAGSVGNVLLTNSSTVAITGTDETPYQGITVGRGGGDGSLILQGYSNVSSTGGVGRLQVGRDGGTGLLSIESGSSVQSFFTEIGRGSGSVGTLNIDGYQSRLTSSDAYGAFDPANYGPRGGFVRVGRGDGGDGTVTITGGGSLNVINDDMVAPPAQADGAILEIGRDTGATGYVRVSGDDGMGNASYIRVQNYGRSNDGYLPGEYVGPALRLGRDGALGELVVEQGASASVVGEQAQVIIGVGTENGDYTSEPTSLITVQSGGSLIANSIPNIDYSRPYNAAADIKIGFETGGNGRLLVTGVGSTVDILSDNATDYYLSNGDLALGAGLEVGVLGRGVLDVIDGGVVTINGADDAFPHLTIGLGEMGATINARGYATVSGAGSLVQILGTSTGAGATYTYGAGGSIDVGTRDGSYGSLFISDGGVVTNSAINSKTQIAQNTGSTGQIVVTGAGSTLNAGTLLTVGADIDLATGAFFDFQSGEAELTIYDMGVINAGTAFVGSTGKLNIDTGTLASDVEITGEFQIADDNIGSATIAGVLTQTTGILEFDLFGNGAGVSADSLTANGAIFSGSAITIDVQNAALLNVGDSATLFQTTGSFSIDSTETINFVGATANAGQEFVVSQLSLPVGQTVVQQLAFLVQQATLASVDGDLEIVVVPSGQVALTMADLSITETGVDPSLQVLTVSSVLGGQLESALDPGVAITTFSQQDVDDRLIRFVSDGMSGATFDLSFTDSSGFEDTVTISVLEGNANTIADFNVGTLDGINGVVLNGIVTGDQAGLGVSDVGDINGDGIADIAVGASFADTAAGNDAGEGYIIFGVDGGLTSPFELSSLDGTNGFTFSGLGPSQLTGVNGSVEGVGDVNNDEIDDFIIGIGGVDSGGVFNVGEAFLIYGTDSGFAANLDLGNLDGMNGTRLVGIDFNSLTGQTVPGLGDVNGDGINDFGISASFGDGAAGTDSGESFVVFGANGGLGATVNLSSLDGTNGFRLEGETAGDNGGVIGRVGDFNNDGLNDFLVGSPNDDTANGANSGNVQIIFGTTAAQSPVRQLGSFDATEGFRIIGLAANDSLGGSVSDGGDLNGDGIDDLIITSKTADVGGVVDVGTTYVIFGTTDDLGGTFDLSTLDGTNGFSVSGSATSQRAGYTSASAGDVNGDGIEDLIIGAVGAAPGGEAYVIFGSTTPFAATFDLDSLNGANGFRISPADTGDVLGRDVSTAGDFNNDGITDILVASNGASPGGRAGAGEAYVIYGVAGASVAAPEITGDFLVDVVLGDVVALTVSDLTAAGGQPGDLLYHVTAATNGFVFDATDPLQNEITTFTQADLESGLIAFLHDGGIGDGSFDFTVTDLEGDVAGPQTFEVNLVPAAFDDLLSTGENTVLAADLFADNGFGADTDFGGGLITLIEIDGVAASVGQTLNLPSGAVLFVSDDGLLAYDPLDLFDSLADGETFAESFTYTIEDDDGAIDTALVTITVLGENDDPFAFDDFVSLSEDDTLSGSVLFNNGNGADFDIDGALLTVISVDGSPTNVNAPFITMGGGQITFNSDGTFGFLTNGAYDFLAQSDTFDEVFTYTIQDDFGGIATANFTLTVNGLNDPPVAQNDIFITDEDTGISGNFFADNGNGVDFDIDAGSTFALSAINGNVPVFDTLFDLPGNQGSLLVRPDGTFDYIPSAGADVLAQGEQAQVTFTYDITDDQGAISTANVLIILNGLNDAPVAFDDEFLTIQGNGFTGNVLADNGIAPDLDIDNGDVLTVVAVNGLPGNVGQPVGLVGPGEIAIQSDGSLEFINVGGGYIELAEGETLVETVTYTIADLEGQQSTATVNVNIQGVNDAPITGGRGARGFLENDIGGQDDLFSQTVSDPEGDPLTLVSIDGQQIQPGGSTIFTLSGLQINANPDGNIVLSDPNDAFNFLNEGETANADFSFVVSDPQGLTATAQFELLIEGQNDAPIAVDDQVTVIADETVEFDPIQGDGVSGQDIDPENTALEIVTIEGQELSPGDTIALQSGANVLLTMTGTLEYQPNGVFDNLGPNQTGQDSFVYEIVDTGELRSEATVFVEILAPFFPPIAADDAVETTQDDVLAINVLADNGAGPDQDFSGNGLLLTGINGQSVANGASVTLASGAVLTIDETGIVSYDPGTSFAALTNVQTAADSFVYTITDGEGFEDVGEVAVSITGLNDAPVALDDLLATDERTAIVGSLFANNGNGQDRDVDGDFMVTAINGDETSVGSEITLPSGALLTIAADGGIRFDPNQSFGPLNDGENAFEQLTYTITDAEGATSDANITIRVSGITDTIFGTDGDDLIRGTDLGDDIDGLGGNDLITGLNGDDTIRGGQGIDIIRGGADDDLLMGGTGKDRIFGEGGNDSIEGGAGNDRLLGLSGNDTVRGDEGDDLVSGGGGNDLVLGGDGDDRLRGGRDSDTLLAGEGKDRLQGGTGNDRLFGQAGNDNLTGAGGADELFGGNGIDRLFGRRGNDELTGGEGVDRFFFNLGDGSDTITDFEQGVDFIRINKGADVFSDLTISQVGDDALITFGNVRILALDEDANDFTNDDFIL